MYTRFDQQPPIRPAAPIVAPPGATITAGSIAGSIANSEGACAYMLAFAITSRCGTTVVSSTASVTQAGLALSAETHPRITCTLRSDDSHTAIRRRASCATRGSDAETCPQPLPVAWGVASLSTRRLSLISASRPAMAWRDQDEVCVSARHGAAETRINIRSSPCIPDSPPIESSTGVAGTGKVGV